MVLDFFKYQGAGNDFVMLHDPNDAFHLSKEQVVLLCHRRFGIGGDGLIILKTSNEVDFQMQYYNSDGSENTFCGNGGRCVALFAHDLGLVKNKMSFAASDGIHEAEIMSIESEIVAAQVSLMMQDVLEIETFENGSILNTGSPHYISWVKDLEALQVEKLGFDIRHQERFEPQGINVNFVQRSKNGLALRTYERGVEAETLACGTGITAAAIASVGDELGSFEIPVKAAGGSLLVCFQKKTASSATNILLKGPAKRVFAGQITL